MSDFDEPYDDEIDEGDQLVAEDWPTVHTPVPVWVMLAGLSAKAFLMYAFLAEHINARIQNPNRRIACPKQKAIAVVLELADDRQVATYRKELEALGAIRAEKYRYAGGMRQGYKYFVRFNPPAGYAGQLRLGDFYNAHPSSRRPRSGRAAPRPRRRRRPRRSRRRGRAARRSRNRPRRGRRGRRPPRWRWRPTSCRSWLRSGRSCGSRCARPRTLMRRRRW
ncbi:hypothetical protein ACFPK5_00480 [Streptomyces beijiangensis]|uniref:hypothetical protein n=1 Tax=Streptomyces beijiangensis TaxID=163361 RepID=UPI00360D725D